MVLAHHIILTGYGHWLPNDIRGSLSTAIRAEHVAPLGGIHYGRKAPQPPRDALRAFHRQAEKVLRYKPLWFDPAKRQALAQAFRETIAARGYTCFACAILSNHVHFVIRRHRDRAEEMIVALQGLSRSRVRTFADVPPGHPIWGDDPFKRFLSTPEAMMDAIAYVEANPRKSGLPDQHHDFVNDFRAEWQERIARQWRWSQQHERSQE